MAKILLLDGENVQVVCMARELKKLGHEVSALCSQKLSSGYATRHLHYKHKCPDLHHQPKEYKDFFYQHINQNSYDLIIPMGDESACFLSREKSDIASLPKEDEQHHIVCAVEDYNIFEQANDKKKLMEVCEKYKITHPKTHALTQETIDEAAEYIGFPAMIKPDLSAGAKGITKVNSLKELKETFPSLEKTFGSCSLQQYVEQPDYYYNVMLFRTSKGEIAAYTIIKIRRYFPLKGGSSCYSETIEHPYLLEQCKTCLDKLNWHGFADFDVLEDKNTGELKIIEINPRVPSSLQASFAARVNFAEVFVNDYLKDGYIHNEYHYKIGQQIRWFGLDMMWFLMSPNRFSFQPTWFRFFGKNISYHDGSWTDPLPMIAGILSGIMKYMNPEFRKAKLN